MQSSGVGNCIDMLSLPAQGRFPFLTLVTMRGEWADQSLAGADGQGHAGGAGGHRDVRAHLGLPVR